MARSDSMHNNEKNQPFDGLFENSSDIGRMSDTLEHILPVELVDEKQNEQLLGSVDVL